MFSVGFFSILKNANELKFYHIGDMQPNVNKYNIDHNTDNTYTHTHTDLRSGARLLDKSDSDSSITHTTPHAGLCVLVHSCETEHRP